MGFIDDMRLFGHDVVEARVFGRYQVITDLEDNILSGIDDNDDLDTEMLDGVGGAEDPRTITYVGKEAQVNVYYGPTKQAILAKIALKLPDVARSPVLAAVK